MKRRFAVLAVCVLLLSQGCSENVGGPDKTTAPESSASTEHVIDKTVVPEPSGPDGESVEASEWPTEEWRTSDPEGQDLDPGLLSEADKRINENYPNVYSLLVVRNGYLVYEKYYDIGKTSRYPIYSVTKSVLSALTGIAIREGLIEDTAQKISDLLPEYFEDVDDARKKEITIANVLTMSGGLTPIDSDYNAYFSSADFLDYTLSQPLTEAPGERFAYNTGLTHFLSKIIVKASGMSTLDFANQHLFSKIGISVNRWDTDPDGCYVGGSGLYMTAAEMAKFGYLYLKNGLWDGEQVIPQEWIAESTKKQVSVNADMDYGYLFWLQTLKDEAHGREYFTYRAVGIGGQKIFVVPELELVVVITANAQSASKDKSDTQEILTEYILPAVK